MKSIRFGIKLWTINEDSFQACENLLKNQTFDYIELYIVPNRYNLDSLSRFSKYEVILHAPSFNHKFNIANKNNIFHDAIKSIQKVSEIVNSTHTIFHPGVKVDKTKQDYLEVVIDNIKEIQELGIEVIIENVPVLALDGTTKLVASSFEDFKLITEKTGALKCIDIAHTVASANFFKIDPMSYIKIFLELEPYMVHICDGDYNALTDKHLNINTGTFPLIDVLKLLPRDIYVSLETPKSDYLKLTDDIDNLNLLKNLLN